MPALRDDAGPLLWDPRGGAIRAARTIEWLAAGLGDRLRRTEAVAVAPGRVATNDGPLACGHVVLCAGRRDGATLAARRDAARDPPAGHVRARRGDRGPGDRMARGRMGGPQRAVRRADLRRRRRAGAVRARARRARRAARAGDPAADVVGPGAADLGASASGVHAYARAAFPGLGPPLDEVVRLLTVLPGDDEDAYVLDRRDRMTVVAGHNLFKLAPLLGEKVARAIM